MERRHGAGLTNRSARVHVPGVSKDGDTAVVINGQGILLAGIRIMINRRSHTETKSNEADDQKCEDDEKFFHDVR